MGEDLSVDWFRYFCPPKRPLPYSHTLASSASNSTTLSPLLRDFYLAHGKTPPTDSATTGSNKQQGGSDQADSLDDTAGTRDDAADTSGTNPDPSSDVIGKGE